MKNNGMTLIEFQERFQTEDDCVHALEKLRWPNGFVCPNCGHDDGYRLSGRKERQCACCRHQTSVTSGTVFHKTRVPLRKWFWIIWLMAQDKGGTSGTRIANQLDMHYSTVWHIMHKIRHAMAKRDENITLGGTIELDEAIFGAEARKVPASERRESNGGTPVKKLRRRTRGRPSKEEKKSTEVVVMVETEGSRAGCLAMKVIDTRTRADIREVVEQRVPDQAYFEADALQSHAVLKSMDHHLNLEVCSGPRSVEVLPWVHTFISLVRRFLVGTYHGVGAERLHYYLAEFCFRANRRFKQNQITDSLLRACVSALPMQYAELSR